MAYILASKVIRSDSLLWRLYIQQFRGGVGLFPHCLQSLLEDPKDQCHTAMCKVLAAKAKVSKADQTPEGL